MKTPLYVLLLLLALTQRSHAENLVGFGLKGGFALSQQNFQQNYVPNLGTILEPTAGLFTDLSLFGPFGFQLETNYIQKGSSITNIDLTGNSPGILGTGTLQYDYTYLEIPLLIKFKTELLPDWKFYLLAGPSLEFLLNETTSFNSSNYPSANASYDQTQLHPGTNWSMDFGVGMELVGFLIDLRYELGLDTTATSSNTFYGQIDSLNLQLGYRLF